MRAMCQGQAPPRACSCVSRPSAPARHGPRCFETGVFRFPLSFVLTLSLHRFVFSRELADTTK